MRRAIVRAAATLALFRPDAHVSLVRIGGRVGQCELRFADQAAGAPAGTGVPLSHESRWLASSDGGLGLHFEVLDEAALPWPERAGLSWLRCADPRPARRPVPAGQPVGPVHPPGPEPGRLREMPAAARPPRHSLRSVARRPRSRRSGCRVGRFASLRARMHEAARRRFSPPQSPHKRPMPGEMLWRTRPSSSTPFRWTRTGISRT